MDDGRYCDDDDDDNEDNVLSSCDSDLTVITICSGLIRAASREIFGHVVDLTVLPHHVLGGAIRLDLAPVDDEHPVADSFHLGQDAAPPETHLAV